MPAWVRDETTWERAKAAASKTLSEADGERYWALVTTIYKKMGGMMKADRPMLLLVKATQLGLFDERVPIRGYTDRLGHHHRPTMGTRAKRHDLPAVSAPAVHSVPKTLGDFSEEEILSRAEQILELRLSARREGDSVMDTPEATKGYLKLKLAEVPHEVFAALWLDNKHRVIKYVELFRGTLTQTAVYPREVVKKALSLNAAALVMVHNHPLC